MDSTDRETSLDAPDSFALARLGSALEPAAQHVERQRVHAIYFDTDDLRLTRWGVSLRFRRPDEWTLHLPAQRHGGVLARAEHRFRGPLDTVPAPALDLATAYLRGGVPHPIAELRTELPPDDALAVTAVAEAVLPARDVDHRSRAIDLLRAALGASVEQLIRNDAHVRLGEDPEAVHQARVAVRRLRSDLRSFRPILDPMWADGLRERLRWLGDALGAARDADVLLERLERQAVALPDVDFRRKDLVLNLLRGVRDAAYRQLRELLREPRYVALLEAAVAAVLEPQANLRAEEPACDVVPEMLDGVWRKLCKAVRRRSRPPADDELHRIRINAKRVRYAAEAVAPVAGRPARRFARRIERLQTILGDQHDAVRSCEQLRAHVGGGDGAFLAGELATLENEAANAARRRWRAAWRDAKSPSLRFWNN